MCGKRCVSARPLPLWKPVRQPSRTCMKAAGSISEAKKSARQRAVLRTCVSLFNSNSDFEVIPPLTKIACYPPVLTPDVFSCIKTTCNLRAQTPVYGHRRDTPDNCPSDTSGVKTFRLPIYELYTEERGRRRETQAPQESCQGKRDTASAGGAAGKRRPIAARARTGHELARGVWKETTTDNHDQTRQTDRSFALNSRDRTSRPCNTHILGKAQVSATAEYSARAPCGEVLHSPYDQGWQH